MDNTKKELKKLIRRTYKANSEDAKNDFINAIKSANNLFDNFEKEELVDELSELSIELRICSQCGNIMTEGYCICGGESYYCCDECLNKNITPREFRELYADGEGDSYYTEWI